MLKAANIAIHVSCFVAVLIHGGLSVSALLAILDAQILVWAVTHFSISRIGKGSRADLAVMTIGFTFFYWIAFVSKLAIFVYFPELAWVVPELLTAEAMRNELAFR